MTDKVIAFNTGTPIAQPGNPDPKLIAALEELLESAREGTIVSVAYVSVFHDGQTGHGISGIFRSSILLGAIELLKRDI